MEEKKRIEWIDNLKGFLIITVLIGHAGGFPKELVWWIYTFHMPLFFVLSGYTCSIDKYKFKEFIIKKIRTLIIPGIFFMIFASVINFIYEMLVLKTITVSVKDFIFGFLLQIRTEPFSIQWFLTVLFLSEIGLFIIIKKIKTRKLINIFLLLLSLISFIITKCAFIFDFDVPYSFDILGLMMSFVYFGYIMKNEKIFMNLNKIKRSILLLSSGVLCFINQKIFGYNVDVCGKQIGSYCLFYIMAIFNIIALMNIFKNIKWKNKLLNYIGRNSLFYYLIHGTFFSFMKFVIWSIIGNKVNNLFISTCIIVCTFIFSYPLLYIINRYFPFILGKERIYNNRL